MSFNLTDGPLDTQCWIFDGALFNNGYGHMRVEGKDWVAHRYYYEFYVGPIPDGLVVDHLCRVRACCNPEHLEVVTIQENNVRSGLVKRKTHCSRGHSYENARKKPNGAVAQCSECLREKYYERKYGV